MIKKICDILSTFIIAVAVIFFIMIYGVNIFGIKAYSVISGSMEPEVSVGSVVYVKSVDAEKIKVGDVITFRKNPTSVNTHRVVEINNKQRTFTTKGDANTANDEPVSFDALVGKVVFTLPFVGYVAVWMSTFTGKCILIGIFVFAVLLITVSEILSKRRHN